MKEVVLVILILVMKVAKMWWLRCPDYKYSDDFLVIYNPHSISVVDNGSEAVDNTSNPIFIYNIQHVRYYFV